MINRKRFYNKLAEFIESGGKHAAWNSHYFRAVPVETKHRALEITNLVFDESIAKSEIEMAERRLGLESDATMMLWKWFAAIRDNVSVFSDGYRDLMEWTAVALDSTENVVDYGVGTGNFAARLKYEIPNRVITGLDISPDNIRLSRAKVRRFSEQNDSDRFIVTDLTLPNECGVNTSGVDGALVINVTYVLPLETRRSFLQRVYNDLAPGGVLVFNNPIPVARDRTCIREFVHAVADDSVKNGAPMTEFDLALMVYFNLKKVPEVSSGYLSSADDLKKLLCSLGFRLISSRKSYYEMNTIMILQKPQTSRRKW